VRGTAPIDATVRAQGDDSGVHITTAEIRQGAVRALEASAHLPWVWDGKGKLVPDPDHCKVDARLTALQLAAPLSLVQTIAQPAGQATGAFTLRGCRDLAGLRGQLALEHTSFTLKDPLLRVDDLSARARVSANAIEIESLQLHDQSGELRGKGKLELKQGKPTRVALQLSSDEFPMRADATVIGFLDGRIGLSANWEALPRDVRVVLSDLSVRLPMRAAREPQELATHADVVYVNAKASAAASPDDDEPAAPVDLRIESEQPFWVRRDDFSVQLETHLRIQTEPSGVRITGTLLIQRGFINLLSKGFDIERGQLLFDGSAHPDPTVVIDAVHKLGDGQTVTVRIRERLSAPVITFSTSIAGVSTDAEIMQLLMRGRSATATETASAQVGAALAGMTSELIGSLGRTKFGKYVPVLSLEAGASSGTRIRAGVEANSLIPAKLRQYIEGAYVEGFVGGRNQGGDAQATGGVLMELYYPKRLVTGGKWELPNNWSVELTWEP
jgi:hypothetical protein